MTRRRRHGTTWTTGLLAGLALVLAQAPATATAGADELPTFAATYRLEYKGSRVGESVISMRPALDGEAYVYEARTEPRGLARLIRGGTIVERSRFVLLDGSLQPIEFVFDDGTRKGKDDNRVSFDHDGASATSVYRGETHEFAIEPALLDRLLSQFALMRDMQTGEAAPSYTVLDRDKLKVYRVNRLRSETVETRGGTFDAVVVHRQREGSSRATLMWLAPDLDFLPVQIRQTKGDTVITEMTLESVAGLPAGL